MAAITASNVTLLDSQTFPLGTASGKLMATRARMAIVLSAQGGTAGDIPASVLGFKQLFIARIISFVVAGTPKNIGIGLSAYAADNSIGTFTAVDGSTSAANVTGTLNVEVEGALL